MADRPGEADEFARLFHETYERLAPEFGYETRKASAVPWEDVPEQNRALMEATAAVVLDWLTARLSEADEAREFLHEFFDDGESDIDEQTLVALCRSLRDWGDQGWGAAGAELDCRAKAEARLSDYEQALRRLQALVDEQAEDEALWALNLDGTLPISEAYLQQELRRLHAAVESLARAALSGSAGPREQGEDGDAASGVRAEEGRDV